MGNKKGFTLVEVLAVVVVLAILSLTVVAAISSYIEKGKRDYDESLKEQFVLAGKDYYSSRTDKLPDKNESTFVSLAELRSLNIVNKDFVDSENNKCSNKDSVVMVTAKGNKNYEYTACLVCPNSSTFIYSDACTAKNDETIVSDDDKKVCEIEKNNNEYIFYDKTGEIQKISNSLDAVKAYKDSECDWIEQTCQPGNVSGIDFYYGEEGSIYNNLTEANDAGECPPPCVNNSYYINPSYSYLSPCTSSYKCILNKTSSYSNISNLISGFSSGQVVTNEQVSLSSGEGSKAHYTHYIKNTAYDKLVAKKNAIDETPSYKSSGTNATVTEYFKDERKTKAKLLSSTYSYVHKNQAIPSEYSFQLGKSSKPATITNKTKMSWSDVKKWGSDMYNEATAGEVTLATEDAKGTYKAKYYSVGSYNGTKVDVVMTLVSYGGCKLRSGASKCGLWFGNQILEVYSLGVEKITVDYTFYKAGTSEKINVKGYTTYWDIDAHQGIHFVKNTTGLYVYNGNATYISNVNGAPYIYDYNDNNYSGYDDAGAVTETFAGTTMRKTFTFMSGNGTDYSKITSSLGQIFHSTVPIGITMSYYSGANSASVLKSGSEVKYLIRFSNPTASDKTIKITDTMSNGMSFVKGSAKFKNGSTTNPSVSENTITWTKTVKALQTDWVIFTLEASSTSCGDLVTNTAKSKIDSTTYTSSVLSNPIICSKQQTIKSECAS